MHSWLFGEVSDRDIRFLEFYPEDLQEKSHFDAKYYGEPNKIHKLIYLSKVYSYLAYTHEMNKHSSSTTFGQGWFDQWLKNLINDDVFQDVHRYLGSFYAEFAARVDKEKDKRRLPQGQYDVTRLFKPTGIVPASPLAAMEVTLSSTCFADLELVVIISWKTGIRWVTDKIRYPTRFARSLEGVLARYTMDTPSTQGLLKFFDEPLANELLAFYQDVLSGGKELKDIAPPADQGRSSLMRLIEQLELQDPDGSGHMRLAFDFGREVDLLDEWVPVITPHGPGALTWRG